LHLFLRIVWRFGLSVVYFTHIDVFGLNHWTDSDAVWTVHLWGSADLVSEVVPDPPEKGAQLPAKM